MWNDGYSKEQPWLNYYNSYERMHCCFGDDGADTSDAEDSGMTAAQAEAVAAAMDAAKDAGASVEGQQAAGDVAAADAQGIDVSEVDSGMSRADASIEDIETLEDLGMIGYNDKLDLGYFDKAEAADFKSSQADAAALENSLRDQGLEVNVAVDRDNNYSYTGKDAFQAATGEIGKSIGDFAGAVGTGVEGMADFMSMISPTGLMMGEAKNALGRSMGLNMGPSSFDQLQVALGLKDAMGKPESEVTQAEIDSVLENKGGIRSDEAPSIAGPSIDALSPTGIGAGYAAQSSPREEEQAAFASMMGNAPAFFDPTVDFSNREDDRNIDAETGIELSDDITNQMGFGDPGSTSWTEDDQLNYDINALNNFQEEYESPYGTVDSMYSRNFPNTQDSQNYWSTENEYEFEPQDGDGDPITKIVPPPPPPVVVDEPPKTALELYFERLNKRRGTAGSVNPYYLEGSAAGNMANVVPRNPIDNANYRRNLALATPRYQEPSGPNQSIATFAAAYGMTYDEAAKRFAPPSVPAMGGGGLRGLMEYS